MNITFNEEDHTYTIDGCPVPPVTHVIKNTVGTGWEASPWYLQRGKAIHACAAFIAQGIDFKFDERLAPYVAALKKFFKEIHPEVYGQEIRVGSSLYQFAGTLDLNCKISTNNCLIDWKHSIDKHRIPLQLGGYSLAFKETFGKEINYGFGVEIRENGTYNMTKIIDLHIPRNEFLALRTTYRIKERCGEIIT